MFAVYLLLFLLLGSRLTCNAQTLFTPKLRGLKRLDASDHSIHGLALSRNPLNLQTNTANKALVFKNENNYFQDFETDTHKNHSIIRNISMVLDNLFKNYDRRERPGQGGAPTVIRTSIHVKSMGPISELEMSYEMDCYFRQSWQDERLKFDAPVDSLSLNIKLLEGIWKPDTYFHNGQKSYIHTITIPNQFVRIEKDGKVLFSSRLTIKAKCPMQLHSFPLDKQSCPLVFGSYAYAMDQVTYVWDGNNAIRFDRTLTLSQFDLVGSPRSNRTVSLTRGRFSTLQINFDLKRHAGYFLIQVYVPCVLIVVLSWVSFWINREATSDRVGLGITTVLTLSTFGVDTRNDLPKVNYATALDWFVIICFSFVIASLLEFAGVHYFTKVGSGEVLDEDKIEQPEDESEWEDVEVKEVNGDCFPSTHVSVIGKSTLSDEMDYVLNPPVSLSARALQRSRHFGHQVRPSGEEFGPVSSCSDGTQTDLNRACCVQLFYCLLGNDSYRATMRRFTEGVNSVSKIDRVSRFLFPCTFAILNLFYWVSLTADTSTIDQ